MRSLRLARGRALTGCACIGLALAGCTSTAASSGSTVAGHTLTIYLSEPSGTLTSEQQDVISAEKLALKQLGNRVASFTVKTATVSGGELSDNARGAIADPTTIAYLGELEPGTSGQTIGITNAQDILQVSPTDTAVELTQSVPEVSGSPGNYYESLSSNGRTFARVVPNDKLEAMALASEIQSLGVKSLYIKSDGSTYGNTLAGQLRADASSVTTASSLTSADAVVYAGTSTTGATSTFDQAASSNSTVKLFVPSALSDDALLAALSPTAQRDLYVISPGFMTSDLPAAGQQFVSAFTSAEGHAPAMSAIFGYAAMEAVLTALQKAGSSANDRGTVVKDFFGIRNHSSVLGTYSIHSDGDISFVGGAPFVLSRVRGGKLVPFKAVQQQG
jgi:branched-chain amino acid transport system substrate-binding protein